MANIKFDWKKPRYELSTQETFYLRVSVDTQLNKMIRSAPDYFKDIEFFDVEIDRLVQRTKTKRKTVQIWIYPRGYMSPVRVIVPGWENVKTEI